MTTKQIETATIIGTVTQAGNGKITVTSAVMPNSPKVISFAVLLNDSASLAAASARSELGLDADVTSVFAVSGTGANIVLTAHVAQANDPTLNIASDNDTCTGLTTAPTSTNTLAGDGITNGYATLAEFKGFYTMRGGVVKPDVPDDGTIEGIIEAVSRYIDNETTRIFYAAMVDETRYYTPHDSRSVFIEDFSSVPTSVAVDLSNTRVYTVIANTQYEMSPENAAAKKLPYTMIYILPNSGSYFPTFRNGVRVIGKPGFPAIPDDIREACLEISVNVYQSRSGQSSAGNITVTASGVVIRPENVPPMAQNTIRHYRRLA
jgi:hypothetical protein